jgi:hypothetical protein
MKPKRTTTARPTKQATAPTMQTLQTLQTLMNGLRRPFANPTPAPDAALRRWGPARPTKPGTQI